MQKKSTILLILLMLMAIEPFFMLNSSLMESNEPIALARNMNEPGDAMMKARNWVQDGRVICNLSKNQQNTVICSDGSGGAIIAWIDNRSGNWDIYAQRINSIGNVQWTINGIAICIASNTQFNHQICKDGAGGAIITWQDSRNGNWDIYAQRINSTGNIKWTTNGVAICNADYDQEVPMICSDGSGGAIVTWQDYRNGSDYDIYSQRIDSIGAVRWTANGVAVCIANNNQEAAMICSDDSGGAIITWHDGRTGDVDIYAQKINSNGNVQWVANGVLICNFEQEQLYPVLCTDDSNGAIIIWKDFRDGNGDIYAQQINSTGSVRWTANGVAICTAPGLLLRPSICRDSWGGAIITWYDPRGADWDIYAQRINSTGAVQWITNGVPICTASSNQVNPQICEDGSGGAIITWFDERGGLSNADIYAQRVNSSGFTQWTANGVAISTAINRQHNPQICSDGSGGAIITWYDERNANWDIYAERIRSIGLLEFLIEAPFAVRASPSTWSNINSFNISWSNPADPSGIVGVYYKLDLPPNSDTDGTYVAGNNITILKGITTIGSGAHTIYIWLKDGNDNIDFNQYNTTTLFYDNQIAAPIGITAKPSSWTLINSFNLSWTNPSDLSGIAGAFYKLDLPPANNTDGTYVAGANITTITGITVIGSGAHAIYIWLNDSAGSIDFNLSNTTMLYLDQTPPGSNTPNGLTYAANGTSSFTRWILSDNVAGGYWNVLCNGTLYGTWTPWTQGENLTLLVETNCGLGAWNYTLLYNDSMGLWGAPNSVILLITDQTAPNLIEIGDFEFEEGMAGQQLLWSVTDLTPANYTIYKNGELELQGNWTSGTILFDLVNLSSGTYSYTLIVEDSVGYIVNDTVIVTVHPSHAPEWVFSALPPQGEWYAVRPLLNLTFTDFTAIDNGWFALDSQPTGVPNLFIHWDMPVWTNSSWQLPFSIWGGLADGPHTLYFMVNDTLGNIEGEQMEWAWSFCKDTNQDSDGDGLNDTAEFVLYLTNPYNSDTDGDGLNDSAELFIYHINATNWDIDNDGLSDGAELLIYMTNVTNPDTDGDGLNDGSEVFLYFTNPNSLDTDGDGLNDPLELFFYYTNASNSDTDGDGLRDDLEIYTYLTNATNPDSDSDEAWDGDEINLYHTDPLNPDMDGDLMRDGWELHYGLNPRWAGDALLDIDNDGLTNRRENDLHTFPNDWDSDNDLIPDGWEVDNHLNPLNMTDAQADFDNDTLTNLAEYYLKTNPNNRDTDGDLMPDGWEVYNSLSPLSSADKFIDIDGDGLTNIQEYGYKTNPRNYDSDNDGYSDGVEITAGTNPLDEYSVPVSQRNAESNFLEISIIVVGIAISAAILVNGVLRRPIKEVQEAISKKIK